MSLLAALLPNERDRESLRSALTSQAPVVWASSWQELYQIVRDRPVTMAVTDLHAEPRRDGALRVYRFHRRYPQTPLVAWGEPDGRELLRLGKAGAADIVLERDATDRVLVSEILALAELERLATVFTTRLRGRVPEDAIRVVSYAADEVPNQVQVPQIARAFEMSVSTLERRCERWGTPTPGRMLLWLRVLYGIRWLLEPGRSVESVAGQLGYSSGAAYRRAVKATIGGRPTPLRSQRGFERALEMFLSEFRQET
jgi:AraC-like DNA-binding protein